MTPTWDAVLIKYMQMYNDILNNNNRKGLICTRKVCIYRDSMYWVGNIPNCFLKASLKCDKFE
jgi:hypothetical protein